MIRAIWVRIAILVYTLLLSIPAMTLVWFYPRIVVYLARIYFWLILKAARGIRIEVSGRENIPAGHCIFLSNHQRFVQLFECL